MGYDASVNCNCYKDRKTIAPPYEELIIFSEDKFDIDIEYLFESDKDEYWNRFNQFSDWLKTACPHENMEIVSVRLANIGGMADFKYFIKTNGGHSRFPVLSTQLPESNVGFMPIKFNQAMLNEINDIENDTKVFEKNVLKIDEEIIWKLDKEATGVFKVFSSGTIYFGLNKNGFYIEKHSKLLWFNRSKVVFSSSNFIQIQIEKEKYLFKDKNSNYQIICNYPIIENENKEINFRTTVEFISVGDVFDYILDPLKKLLLASIETNNPINWH